MMVPGRTAGAGDMFQESEPQQQVEFSRPTNWKYMEYVHQLHRIYQDFVVWHIDSEFGRPHGPNPVPDSTMVAKSAIMNRRVMGPEEQFEEEPEYKHIRVEERGQWLAINTCM